MAPTSKAFVTVVLLSLALCQITAAEPSLEDDDLAKEIVLGIKQLSALSRNLRIATLSITPDKAAVRGILIPRGFEGISTQITVATVVILSAKNTSLSEPDAKLVVETLKKFVERQQKLLDLVIEKHQVGQLLPYFKPIRLSLRKLEFDVLFYEFALIRVIPTQEESAAKKQFDTLTHKIKETIKIYESKTPLTSDGDSPVEDIQEALTTFLQAQQAMLNVVNGKHGITTYAGDLA